MSDYFRFARGPNDGDDPGWTDHEDWQPIITAPKDGTKILAYGRYGWSGYAPDEIGQAVVVWSDISTGPPQGPGWKLVNANPYDDVMIATHWKPLGPDPTDG